MSADPQIVAVAEGFVSQVTKKASHPLTQTVQDELVRRAARAIQQAVDEELTAIRKDIGLDLASGYDFTEFVCTDCGFSTDKAEMLFEHMRTHGYRRLVITGARR